MKTFYIATGTGKFDEGNILVSETNEAPDGFVIVGDEFSNVWYPTEEKAEALIEITEVQYNEISNVIASYSDEDSDEFELELMYENLIGALLKH